MYGPKYQLALSNQPKLFSNYRANFVWIMSSLRRSSRRTTTPVHVASAAADTVIVDGQTALTAATTLKEETKAMVIKKESKRSISTTTITKKNVKRVKKEELTDNAGEPPKNWDIIYDKLEAYREINKAAVDTMGCERLADRAKTPQIQRFQTLVSLMLSAQTKDTVTSVAVIKLQTELPGGLCLESILKVDERVLDDMIKAVGFHTKKAAYIKRTSEILRDQYNGDIPDTIEGLTSLPGVGPKMGYLTLQVAWNKNLGIGVDVHVHRISNRLGWVKTKNPEETRLSLQSWLPTDKWKKINPIMVGYGQIVCLPRGPHCDLCPVNQYCPSSELKQIIKKQELVKIKSDAGKEEESIYFKKEQETLEW